MVALTPEAENAAVAADSVAAVPHALAAPSGSAAVAVAPRLCALPPAAPREGESKRTARNNSLAASHTASQTHDAGNLAVDMPLSRSLAQSHFQQQHS